MRKAATYAHLGRSERLRRRIDDDPPSFWTVALGDEPSVYGERLVESEGAVLRRWDPFRSKLGAALAKGWTEPLPRASNRWLYLGAATGTTASHVADLVGPTGGVYAVEKSLRPFARLVRLAERYPNLGPILSDARHWENYLEWVPMVDGLYADIAQPDQVEIVVDNAVRFVRDGGAVLLALKTASMGRTARPREHLARALDVLEEVVEVEEELALDPFHRRHYLIGGRLSKRAALGPPRHAPRRTTPPSSHGGRRR